MPTLQSFHDTFRRTPNDVERNLEVARIFTCSLLLESRTSNALRNEKVPIEPALYTSGPFAFSVSGKDFVPDLPGQYKVDVVGRFRGRASIQLVKTATGNVLVDMTADQGEISRYRVVRLEPNTEYHFFITGGTMNPEDLQFFVQRFSAGSGDVPFYYGGTLR